MTKPLEQEMRDPGPDRARAAGPEIRDIIPLYDIGGPSYFGFRVVLAGKLFDRCINAILAEDGELSLPEWRVLAQLALLPVSTVRALANGAAVDRSESSRALRALELRKLVERSDNPADLRSPLFALTEDGRKVFGRLRQPISDFIGGLVRDVEPADIAAADRVLWAITSGCLKRV